jgi:FG-GAP repeat
VGDVNGDGVDDLMIGAPFNGTNVGHAYVVFGTDEGFPAELELADLLAANGGDGTDGFALNGVPVETGIESAGARVGGTGDINDDGIGDLIVGASAVFQSGLPDQAYVVFGTDEGFPAELELADLLAANGGDGTRGFALNGALEVAAAGDVDSDGIDDLILGAGGADPNGINSGRAYVVFGTNEGFPAELELSDLLAVNGGDGTLGFALNGAAEGEVTGTSVAGAGDIDDDGIDDLIIGASNADPNGINSGRAYVVFGRGPEAAIERLIARVEAAGLPGGIENSLVSKLDSALGLLARDNTTGAISKLGDFVDQVAAQRGKQIDEGDADAWIADAQAILDALRTA